MLQSIRFPNKLLCMETTNDFVLIGDCRGNIYKILLSEIKNGLSNKITKNPFIYCGSPISSIQVHEDDVYYTTWDGDIYKNKQHSNLWRAIIKAMIIHNNLIYVSIDLEIVVLNLNLTVLKKINVLHKVLCFCKKDDLIFCGFNLPIVGILDSKFNLLTVNVNHDTGILSIKCIKENLLTGSVDGSLQKQSIIPLHENTTQQIIIAEKCSKWVRCIFDETLYTRGNEVLLHNNVIITHEDEVMGIQKTSVGVLSVGLDCTLRIYTDLFLLDDELREINELNLIY